VLKGYQNRDDDIKIQKIQASAEKAGKQALRALRAYVSEKADSMERKSESRVQTDPDESTESEQEEVMVDAAEQEMMERMTMRTKMTKRSAVTRKPRVERSGTHRFSRGS